jgi:hypothetical protein
VSYAEKESKLTHDQVWFYIRLGTAFLIEAVSWRCCSRLYCWGAPVISFEVAVRLAIVGAVVVVPVVCF